MTAINIKNLNKTYSSGFSLKIDYFQLEKGTIQGLIGENGAGKTTMIKTILGVTNYEGEILVFGKPLTNEAKNDIGILLDDAFLPYSLTPTQVEEILKEIYKNWDSNYYYELLTQFKLPKDQQIKEFSKGMKIKAKIATVLAPRPKLLILDEPTTGLDPLVREEILDIFYEFISDEEHSILISSHITGDLEKIADYIALIDEGRILWNQDMETIRENLGIATVTEEELLSIDKKDYIFRKDSKYTTQLLVENKFEFSKKYPDVVVERGSIEEIMSFYLRGEQS